MWVVRLGTPIVLDTFAPKPNNRSNQMISLRQYTMVVVSPSVMAKDVAEEIMLPCAAALTTFVTRKKVTILLLQWSAQDPDYWRDFLGFWLFHLSFNRLLLELRFYKHTYYITSV
ncbi:unnamed protein product [Nippostrongylus brasiliensis]|uniref:Uncharacterized protein n=1 Tax=Nippostrongylus brasiliensis TaxID=27835 RepID=A0A0N4XR41_NIPBR|nr:unnamed protein product [Nippostrongylus brasiliensis]